MVRTPSVHLSTSPLPWSFLFVFFIALMIGPVQGHAETYSITDLGTLGGGYTGSVAFAISGNGQVAGGANLPSGGTAFLWKSATGMSGLGTLGGAGSAGYGVNNTGQVVGGSSTVGGEQDGFLFSGGVMTDLGPGVAQGINNDGQVLLV